MANNFFGFNTTQADTLRKLLGSTPTNEALQDEIDAVEVDVAAAESAISDLEAAVAALTTYAENLNAWAVALATKLNADDGVTDTDFDIDPQA
jgi:predicted  nucleic acid-binding Zn-ribbon protein